jgi:hypothetical protein
MKASDDKRLYSKVRRHVDDVHPELDYAPQEIRDMIKAKAYDA